MIIVSRTAPAMTTKAVFQLSHLDPASGISSPVEVEGISAVVASEVAPWLGMALVVVAVVLDVEVRGEEELVVLKMTGTTAIGADDI